MTCEVIKMLEEPDDTLSDKSSESEDDKGLDRLEPMSVSKTIMNVVSFVKDTIRSLLRLSATIQNPAPSDRYLAARGLAASYYEQFDVKHVGEIYSGRAPEFLIHRLGKANTARRQFLEYSKTHREKLKNTGAAGKGFVDTASTVATSVPGKFKQPGVDWTQVEYPDDVSQTTINTSAPGAKHLDVVPFPANANYEEEFECPLCFCIVLIRDWRQWK